MAPEVLVVEDDSDLRAALIEVLSMSGFRPVEAASGREALRHLRERPPPPRVILLDMMMRDMNGWEFRAEQLCDPALAEIPVIIMSGLRSARDVPGHAFILKPFGSEDLLRTVARVAGLALT